MIKPTSVLDLGMHPLADSFISKFEECEPFMPLDVMMDKDIGLFILIYDTSYLDRYNYVDYSYTSNNSKTANEHWKSFAKYINSEIKTKSNILEIGSNDGILLNRFKSQGHTVVGIDASRYSFKYRY